jgi:hypothetical protein
MLLVEMLLEVSDETKPVFVERDADERRLKYPILVEMVDAFRLTVFRVVPVRLVVDIEGIVIFVPV